MACVDPAWELSVDDVQRMRAQGEDFLLLDVRQPEEHALARIEGATFVPLGDLPTQLPRLQEHAERAVVTYCHRGMRSLHAAAFLRQQGFENVRSMAGGIDAWSQQIDPAVPRY